MPGFLASNWFAVMAPAGTPQEIIQKINTEIKKIHLMSDVKDILNKQGIEPFWLNTQQLDALIRSDLDKYAKIIKISKISITSGGTLLQEYTGNYLLSMAQRDFSSSKYKLFSEMIGNVAELTDPANAGARVNSYPNSYFSSDPAGTDYRERTTPRLHRIISLAHT
jgi:hypothetical protein